MRKPAICICENKDTDRLRGYREADQRLRFRHTDSAIPNLSKSEISSIPSSVAVQPDLCQTWSETPKTGFLTTRLILDLHYCDNVRLGFTEAPLNSTEHPFSTSRSINIKRIWKHLRSLLVFAKHSQN